MSRTGTTPTPFGFVGAAQYQTDAHSGLQLLGHRYYDASIGRFISSDPIQDGMNWYAYCENNPTARVDPLGFNGLSIYGGEEGGNVGWGWTFWWLKPSGGDVLQTPSKRVALRAMVDADWLYFWGHGGKNGQIWVNNGEPAITVGDIDWVDRERRRLHKPKLAEVILDACYTADYPKTVDSWLKITDSFQGYKGSTWDSGPGTHVRYGGPGLSLIDPHDIISPRLAIQW